MADIDVSYVVTAYNKAPFIDGMIGSLRTQGDQSRAEYIFIDDGSTDGSADLIEACARDLPRVTIIRQENAGPAPATNAGVRHAVGRYVKLLDADDLLIGGITPLLCAELDRVQGDLIKGELATYRVGERAPQAATLGTVRVLDDALYTVIATGIANTSGTLFRRSAFIEAGGCDETVFVQDFSFFLRMARRGRYLLTNVPVACIPEIADGRVSGVHGQALHDVNRALLNYVAADPDLPAMYKCLAMRRAAGRTWKWAHRLRGVGLFSKPFLVHLLSRLPIPALAPWILRNACRPFYADGHLRFPGARI